MLPHSAAAPGFELIDAHCHLEPDDFRRPAPEDGAFVDERPEVLARARAAGLVQLVVIGSGHGAAEVRNAVALARSHEHLFAAVGVHPHDARVVITPEAPDREGAPPAGDLPRGEVLWDEIARLAATEARVVAVGETGLDYHYNLSPPEVQKELFRRTLRLSATVGKPAVLHIRDAHPEALAIVREEGSPAGGVIHCFTGGPDEARAWLELGFAISLSGIVTFKTATAIQDAAKFCPYDRILLETDSPYLAPVPLRGKKCEPAFIVHTAKFVAGLRGVDVDALTAQASANTGRRLRIAL